MIDNKTKQIPEREDQVSEKSSQKPSQPKPQLDPVRYGDWEKNGRCIDF